MKKKILFIINPTSGIGRHKTIEKLIEKKLNTALFDRELTYTNARKHAIELSKRGVEENFDTIVAVGGDGSVNEVARSVIGTNSTLAILPCGSGNGTARNLKIPVNLLKAMEIINQGKSGIIDTININNEVAINVAGIGYAAHISHEFSKLKNRGFLNYIKIAVKDSIKYNSQQCEIEIKNQPKFTINAFILDVANGSQWGNNAVIAPHAKNNDGLLDLCIVYKFPFINFPVMATRLFTNSIDRSKFVKITKIKEAVIRQENTYAHVDGEPVILGNELRVRINPLSLKVIIP